MSHVWRLDNRDESRERRGPDLGQTTCRRGHGGRPRRRPSQPRACLPHCHAARPHSGRTQRTLERTDTGRTPDAGGRTLDTWTLRHPHRTPDTDRLDSHPWDTGRSHRTPTRTGRRQHNRRPASWGLLDERPHAGPQPCTCSRTTRQLLGRSVGQAAPRRIAVLGRFRVERRAARWQPSGIRRGGAMPMCASQQSVCWWDG
jgi:hypothetical protein